MLRGSMINLGPFLPKNSLVIECWVPRVDGRRSESDCWWTAEAHYIHITHSLKFIMLTPM